MNDIAKKHHADGAWASVMARIRHEMARRGAHPAQTVVLVPYAQLMHEARSAWSADRNAAHFVPRFETTMNWTRSLGGFAASGDDIRLDAAVDALTAAALLVRAGLAGHQTVLAPRLMEAAWSLGGVAAATAPAERVAWGLSLGQALAAGMDSPVLALEAAVARIAVAWAASSSYPSDLAFDAQPGLLVVLEGFQTEPLARALQLRLGERGVSLPLHIPVDDPAELAHAFAHEPAHESVHGSAAGATLGAGRQGGSMRCPLPPGLALHAMQDAEDEAQAAAACVLAHLAHGRSPVGLVAVDRVLTRRVRAMLGDRGLAVRDETGWKLSTTRAAAALMGLLRACTWDASTDVVLDWLKNAPAFHRAGADGLDPGAHAVANAEIAWRKAGLREWRWLAQSPAVTGSTAQATSAWPASALPEPSAHTLVAQANAIRDALQQARPLPDWLRDLRTALQAAGQWPALVSDDAGQAVVQALRLADGQAAELADFATRMSLSEFTAWVSQTLEAASFLPAHPTQAQVVLLPLSQLLGRPLAAVVLPGCDEVRLPMAPEPPGDWTPAQRELLGLPSRQQLADIARLAWRYALQSPQIDLLWRSSEGGERIMPSGFVQELLLKFDPALPHEPKLALDPRVQRGLASVPCAMPQPHGDALPVARLSASAYEDLRRCPYRFFALRQLKLQEPDELDSELGKRDFGNWLHSLLKRFHEAAKKAPALGHNAQLAIINEAANEAAVELGLSTSEFLPFAAAWPRVRAGYLQWLATHEASGAAFDEGEAWKETPLGAVTLIGKLDRIDRLADGSALVIDYKTEGRGVTSERIKQAAEDTQLAFYAALLHDDTLAAAYVNIGEKDATRTYGQPDIDGLRDQLVEGIVDDMSRIRGGAPMPALGEGKACDFCAARGLCRRDFWK